MLANASLALLATLVLPQVYNQPDQVFTAPSTLAFAKAVAIENGVLAIGSQGFTEDSVHIYDRSGPAAPWEFVVQHVNPGSDGFGSHLALWGDVLAADTSFGVGGGVSSQVLIFERDVGGAGAWGQSAVIPLGQLFRDAVMSLTLEGDRLVIGGELKEDGGPFGPVPGLVAVFDRDVGGGWTQAALLTPAGEPSLDEFGASVALDGDRILVGAPESNLGGSSVGAGFVFEWTGAQWVETATLVPVGATSFTFSGSGVALVGDSAFLGGNQTIHQFDLNPFGAWTQVRELRVPGTAGMRAERLAAHGDQLVASPFNSFFNPVTIFDRDQGGAGAWGALAQLTTSRGYNAASISEEGILLGARIDLLAGQAKGLARDPVAGTLYAIDETSRLFQVDPTTGGATEVGSGVAFAEIEALAWDPTGPALLAADDETRQLIRIDPGTGYATVVGPLAGTHVYGLASNPVAGVLFGLRADPLGTLELVTVDPATAISTTVGPTGVDSLRCLAFDAAGGRLYAGESGPTPKSLYELDPNTGVAVEVGPMGSPLGVRGLVFDPVSGRLWGLDGRYPSFLMSIDPTSGVAFEVGPFAPGWFGAGHYFEPPSPSASYCTAGTSAAGCAATIGTFGFASASRDQAFALHASGLEPNTQGLFFFGANGRQAQPWGNGSSYQCVTPPVARLGLQSGSGGVGACDGSFYQDVNALWCPPCPKPALNPGAGTLVQAQLWYRDPASTSNQSTSLSDAVEFAVLP